MVSIASFRKQHIRRAIRLYGGQPFEWIYFGECTSGLHRASACVGRNGQRLPIAGLLQGVAASIRTRYIDYIGHLSVVHHSLLWWAAELSEKNLSISKVFRNLCYVQVAMRLLEQHPTRNLLVIVESDALAAVLRRELNLDSRFRQIRDFLAWSIYRWWSWLVAGLAAARFILSCMRTVYQTRRILRTVPSSHLNSEWRRQDVCVFNVWVDERSFDQSGYRDAYFGNAASELKSAGHSVAYLANILPTVDYRTTLRQLLGTHENIVLPFAHLTFLDFVRAAVQSLRADFARRRYPAFDGVEVSRLIQTEMRGFWMRAQAAYPLLRFHLIRRLKASGLRIKVFLYPFENMRWEKVCCLGLRENYPEARVIGYAHSSISTMALNHFWSPAEKELMTIPDTILVNGEVYVALLKRCGFANARVTSVGAIRYEYLFKDRGKTDRVGPEPDRRVILVTPSIDRDAAIEMIEKVVEAFAPRPDLKVLIKCHPLLPFSACAPEMSAQKLPLNFEIVAAPVSQLLLDASVILYSDSTTAVEAVFLGVPAVQVSSDRGIDVDPLDVCPELRVVARSAEDLRQCVEDVFRAGSASRAELREHARRQVERMFSPVAREALLREIGFSVSRDPTLEGVPGFSGSNV